MHINVPCSLPVYTCNNKRSSGTPVTYTLRCDKANIDLYYNTSMKLLSDIKMPWHLLTGDCLNKHSVLCSIDTFYADIVTALQISSDRTVPKQKSDF